MTGFLLPTERHCCGIVEGLRPSRDPAPPAVSPVRGFGGDGADVVGKPNGRSDHVIEQTQRAYRDFKAARAAKSVRNKADVEGRKTASQPATEVEGGDAPKTPSQRSKPPARKLKAKLPGIRKSQARAVRSKPG